MIEELQGRLSRWLGIPDPSINYHAALEKRHPETGLWLLNGDPFDQWKSSTSSLMWLHGNGALKLLHIMAGLINVVSGLRQDRVEVNLTYKTG
jgi:hypothetical protein